MRRPAVPTDELIQRLAAIVGPAHAELSHLREWRELYAGRTAVCSNRAPRKRSPASSRLLTRTPYPSCPKGEIPAWSALAARWRTERHKGQGHEAARQPPMREPWLAGSRLSAV